MLSGFILAKSSPKLSGDRKILVTLHSPHEDSYTIAITANGIIENYTLEDFITRFENNIPEPQFEISIHRPVVQNTHRFNLDLPWGQKLYVGNLPKNVFFEITVLTATGNAWIENNHVFIVFKDGNAYPYHFSAIAEFIDLPSGRKLIGDIRFNSAELAKALTQKFETLRQNHVAETISTSIQNLVYGFALVLIAIMFTPLGLVHPTLPKPQEQYLTVVWQGTSVQIGDEVVVTYRDGNGDTSIFTGPVINSSTSMLIVGNEQAYVNVDIRQLLGKILFKIPFIGKLL